MNIKKIFIGLLIVILFVVFTFLIFLITTDSIKNGDDNIDNNKEFKVALISEEGREGNLLVNNVYSALDESKGEFGNNFEFKEGISLSALEGSIQSFSDGDYSLIYLIGKDYRDTMVDISKKYPKVDFILINFKTASSSDNLTNLELNYRGSGFVKGVLAGELTETNIVSTIGLKEEAVVLDEMYGFKKGVERVSMDIRIQGGYVATSGAGATVESIVNKYLSYGADVFSPMALDSNKDILNILNKNKVKAIVNNEAYLAEFKDIIQASISIDVKKELLDLTLKAKSSGLKGENIIAPITVDFIGSLDSGVADKVKDIANKINSGQLNIDTIVPMEW